MIDEYIRRKHDPAQVKYLLPQLEAIQKETYGVIVYQEQVMQIASELAGFSLGEADVLRKAMGKKKPEVMASMEEKFVAGCKERRVPPNLAKEIWDQVVEFAGYGFNKAHSAAYALLAYQTAYLKANYPVHFMAALLTSDRDVTDKVVRYISECREMGIAVLPPDVNESHVSFTATGDAIRFGLAAVKGVGEGAVLAILEARERLGSFSSLYQFCEEVDFGKGVNRRTVESLIKCGAFDSMMRREGEEPDPGDTRAQLMAILDPALDSGQRRQRDRRMGQTNLFGLLEEGDDGAAGAAPEIPVSVYECWDERDILAAEKESLGFYITGHPLERHRKELEEFANATTVDLPGMNGSQEVALGAIINGIRDLKTRKGDRMAVLTVEDLEGSAEVVVFPDAYRACYNLLNEDEAVLISGRPEKDGDSARMIAADIQSLTSFFEQKANAKTREVLISVTLTGLSAQVPEQLRDLLERHRGEVPVSLTLQRPQPNGFRARVAPNRFLWVTPSPELVSDIEELLGQGSVRLRR
jgi:DNA polymerase-3 subunit alpha